MAQMNSEQLEWFKANYSDTTNDDICRHLNISLTTLHKFARFFGLKKSKEFMRKWQADALIIELKKQKQ